LRPALRPFAEATKRDEEKEIEESARLVKGERCGGTEVAGGKVKS